MHAGWRPKRAAQATVRVRIMGRAPLKLPCGLAKAVPDWKELARATGIPCAGTPVFILARARKAKKEGKEKPGMKGGQKRGAPDVPRVGALGSLRSPSRPNPGNISKMARRPEAGKEEQCGMEMNI
jgi:hypothetical protein